MQLEDLVGLTTEQKFKKAGEFAGVPADVLDRQWATESSRGKHLVGPDTKYGKAKGHFQFIDSTAETMAGRLGVKYDPSNFDVGLLFAANLWKENMQRYGNVKEAAAAYHGGTDRRAWGPITRDYVQKLTGEDVAVTPGEPAIARPEQPDARDVALAVGTQAIPNEPTGREAGLAAQESAFAAEAKQDEIGIGGVFFESLRDARDMPTWRLMDAANAPREVLPPNYSYSAIADEVEAFAQSEEEIEQLREAGARGPGAIEREKGAILYQRSQDAHYAAAGPLNAFVGRLAGGLFDPASAVAGFGISKAFQLAKIGSGAMIAAGRPGAAVASQTGENILGNVLIEVAADAHGKVSTEGDYIGAVAGSALLTAPFMRGVFRSAADQAARNEADALFTKALTGEPQGTTVEARTVIAEQQAQNMLVNRDKTNEGADQAFPTDLRNEVEIETGNRVREPEPELPEAPPPKAKVTAPDAPDAPLPPKALTDAEVGRVVDALEVSQAKKGWTADKTLMVLQRMSDEDALDLSKLSPEVRERLDLQMLSALQGESNPAGALTMSGGPAGKPTLTTDGMPLRVTSGYWSVWRDQKGVRAKVAEWEEIWKDTPNEDVAGSNPALAYMRDAFGNVNGVANGHSALRWLVKNGDAKLAPMADYLLKTIDSMDLKGTRVIFSNLKKTAELRKAQGKKMDAMAEDARGGALTAGEVVVIPSELDGFPGFADTMKSLSFHGQHTTLHEIGHAVTSTLLDHIAHLKNTGASLANLNPAIVKAYDGLEAIRLRLRASMTPAQLKREAGASYSTLNVKEFVAQLLADWETQNALANLPASKGFGGSLSSALKEAVRLIADLLGFTRKVEGSALNEAYWNLEQILLARDVPIKGVGEDNPAWTGGAAWDAQGKSTGGTAWPGNGAPEKALPAEYLAADLVFPDLGMAGAPRNPNAVATTRRDFAERMYDHARDFMRRNPINMAKLNVVTKRFGAMSDGLKLASSKNPIMQMVASLVTETTTGAAGRKVTAAVRKETLYRKLMGDSLLVYDTSFSDWANRNGGGMIEDIAKGDKRRQFDRLVYEEILNRRENQVPTVGIDAALTRAVDRIEAAMERALKSQKGVSTLGSQRLPVDSVGYIPQALSGKKLAVASKEEIAELTDHLAAHWLATGIASDAQWAKDFSIFYVDRARARAMGQGGVDVSGQASSAGEVIRETLEAMAATAGNPQALAMATKAKAALSAQGLGQTKRRLDVDLRGTLPGGKTVLDFYETDISASLRRYMNRTAGTVALTEFGIHGSTGIRYLMDSARATSDNPAELVTREELLAAERVFSEMLGTPYEGEVRSQVAMNLRMLSTVQRLGGVVWNQFAEYTNLVSHLGLSSMLKGMGALPQMMGEVGRLKRGAPAGNHILTSIEQIGGDIGMDDYRLVMPLDAPDGRYLDFGNDPGLMTRVLTAGGHLQSKVTFFRGLMAAQHRATAEQITLKAMRYVREGGNDGALKDMGFSDDLLDHMRQNIGRIATFDSTGRVQTLDITQLPNMQAAEQFVAAVHRGTKQIIQGTFIGERNSWVHNDWAKLFTQFRTFGLVAVEKQWGRQRMNHGYAKATAMLLGQMAFAIPVYLARVHAMSLGREDQESYVKKAMEPKAMVRALMNYSSMSGVGGDAMDGLAAIAGGWNEDVAEAIGPQAGTRGALTVGGLIPAAGSLDAAGRVLSGKADLYTLLKQAPGSNIPLLVPFINLTKTD